MDNKRNVLIFSEGTSQFLSQIILLRQLNIEKNIAGVIKHSRITKNTNKKSNLFIYEQWVYKKLNIEYISDLKFIYSIWGINKYQKVINLFRLKKLIKKEILQEKPNFDFDKIEEVTLTYHKSIGKLIFLSLFKNLKKIHFVADGSVTQTSQKQQLKLPFYLKLINIKNYINDTTPIVYHYEEGTPHNHVGIKVKHLKNSIRKEVFNTLTSTKEFDKWINTIIKDNKSNKSILFLQPFEYVNQEVLKNIYLKIIKKELLNSDNSIIIKHHPRQVISFLNELKKEAKNIFGNKVSFYNEHFLSQLPIEVYHNKISVNRVITVFSSAVYFWKNTNTEILIYNDVDFPKETINKVIETAKYLNVKYINLTN